MPTGAPGEPPATGSGRRGGVTPRTPYCLALLCAAVVAAVALLPATALLPAAASAASATRSAKLALEPAQATDPAAPGVVLSSGRDEPDPFLLQVKGVDYLFTSQGDPFSGNAVPVQAARSVGAWGPVTDALPQMPAWALAGFTWAPDVHRFGRHWVLYFSAIVQSTNPGLECIGAAVGAHPAGPYVAQPHPFICQLDHQGSIDPRTFVGPHGIPYMLWKSDDNANGAATPTSIYSQRLSADGLHLLGTPARIFAPDEPWQGTIVEAPDLVAVGNTYWLFYSGNWFDQPVYAIGAARCASPLGPCADVSSEPLLASNAQGEGPGEESVFRDARGVWLLYAPFRFNSDAVSPPRPVVMARVGFGVAGPYLGQPDPGLVFDRMAAAARAPAHRRNGVRQ